jgi:ubiquinone/menaquinone biosynthesis C-methylase UbiE
VRGRAVEPSRQPQLSYSEIQDKTHDEAKRRTKAAKIRAVLEHFYGREDLTGLTAVDVGCSTGFTAAELSAAGAKVVGLDIDVPGLGHAAARFGDQVEFLCADGTAMPFADQSVDIVVFNHIYEHVVDPDGVLAEIRRILRLDGAAYLGFANRLGIIEPHYRLPFLSWLPRNVADRYVAMTGRAPNYYEQFRTRRGLRRMCAGLVLWDYTYTVLSDSEAFKARDMVPQRFAQAPPLVWRLLSPIMPTFIWIGTPGIARPRGKATRHAPDRLPDLLPL